MAIPFGKLKTKLGLDDVLPFGRHAGYTVLEIIKDHPQYISWLIQNTSLRFYPSVHEELSRHIIKHVPKGAGVLSSNLRKLKRDMWNQEWMNDPIYLEGFDDIPF